MSKYIEGSIAARHRWPEHSSALERICYAASALDRNTGGPGFDRRRNLSIYTWALGNPELVEAVIIQELLEGKEEPLVVTTKATPIWWDEAPRKKVKYHAKKFLTRQNQCVKY